MKPDYYYYLSFVMNQIINSEATHQNKFDDLIVYNNLINQRLEVDKFLLLLLSYFWQVKYIKNLYYRISDKVRIGQQVLEYSAMKISEYEYLTNEPIRRN